MANKRRAQQQIENDCKIIQEATRTAKSMRELGLATGLSIQQISTTLSKHPIIFKRVKTQLDANKIKNVQNPTNSQNTVIIEAPKQPILGDDNYFVLDISTLWYKNLKNFICQELDNNIKFILTSVTIRELSKFQSLPNCIGNMARYILNLAVYREDSFKTVVINETYDTIDECIVQFCVANKEKVKLLTSKESMFLTSKMHSIKVQYLQKKEITNMPYTTETSHLSLTVLMYS